MRRDLTRNESVVHHELIESDWSPDWGTLVSSFLRLLRLIACSDSGAAPLQEINLQLIDWLRILLSEPILPANWEQIILSQKSTPRPEREATVCQHMICDGSIEEYACNPRGNMSV